MPGQTWGKGENHPQQHILHSVGHSLTSKPGAQPQLHEPAFQDSKGEEFICCPLPWLSRESASRTESQLPHVQAILSTLLQAALREGSSPLPPRPSPFGSNLDTQDPAAPTVVVSVEAAPKPSSPPKWRIRLRVLRS